MLGGGMLALSGLARGGIGGVATTAVGGGLVFAAMNKGAGVRSLNAVTHHGATVKEERSVTIGKPREELYRFWRDLTHLPRFMEGIESVVVRDETHSHWTMLLSTGGRVEWGAEVFADEPGTRIAWRSLEGSDIANAGTVTFKDGPPGRDTVVSLVINYEPPAGPLGKLVAQLMPQEPGKVGGKALRRFKQLMETGEIATAEYRPGMTSDQAEATPDGTETDRAMAMAGTRI